MLRVVLVAVLIVLLARAFWRVVDGVMEGLSAPAAAGASLSAACRWRAIRCAAPTSCPSAP